MTHRILCTAIGGAEAGSRKIGCRVYFLTYFDDPAWTHKIVVPSNRGVALRKKPNSPGEVKSFPFNCDCAVPAPPPPRGVSFAGTCRRPAPVRRRSWASDRGPWPG